MHRSTITVLVTSLILTANLAAQSSGYRVTGVAADDVLNLRSGPAQSSGIIARLAPTTSGIEKVSDTVWNGEDDWVKIRVNSIEGWTRPKYLQRLDARASTTLAENNGSLTRNRGAHHPASDIEQRRALMHFSSMGAGYLSSPKNCIIAADLIRKEVVSPSDRARTGDSKMIWERVLAEYSSEGLASSPRKPNDWPAVNSMVEALMEQDFADKSEFLRRFFVKAVNRKVSARLSDSRETRLQLAERALDAGANVRGGVVLGLADAHKNLNHYFGYSCLRLEAYSAEARGTVSRVAAKIDTGGGGGLDSFQQGLDLAREEAQLTPLVAATVLAVATGAVISGAPKVAEKAKQFVQEGARLQLDEMNRASAANASRCPRCNGYGKVDPPNPRFLDGMITCPRCDGTRWLRNGLPYKP